MRKPKNLGRQALNQRSGRPRLKACDAQNMGHNRPHAVGFPIRKRNLDVYGLWAMNKDTKIRLTLTNLLKTESVTTALYDDASLHQVQRGVAQSFVKLRLGVELRL